MDHPHASTSRDGDLSPGPAVNVHPGTPQQPLEEAAVHPHAAGAPLPSSRPRSRSPSPSPRPLHVHMPVPELGSAQDTPLHASIPRTSSPPASSPSGSLGGVPRISDAPPAARQPPRQPSEPQAGPSTYLGPTPPPKPSSPYSTQSAQIGSARHVSGRRQRSNSPADDPQSRPLSMHTPREERSAYIMNGPYPSTMASPVVPQVPQRALSFAEPNSRPTRRPSGQSNGPGMAGWNGYGNGVGGGSGSIGPNSYRPHTLELGDVPVVREEDAPMSGRPPNPRHFSAYSSSVSTGAAKNITERLEPTLSHAKRELQAAILRARVTGWTLNIAIAMQILLGALTTGIAAATTGRATSIATSVLGGMSTLAASYLAKARGSGEPEASTALKKDLEHYVREVEAFTLDHGHITGPSEFDARVQSYRNQFEEIMGREPSGFEKTIRDKFHSTTP